MGMNMGMGMGMGMGDAFNLAWKLALAARGLAAGRCCSTATTPSAIPWARR
jgi:2-polyprenyl-6-methoxyphenol hydroxylase-like FAD-dependent oxidoreductase